MAKQKSYSMKVNEMYLVESDHFKERIEERNITLKEIGYMLESKIQQLRLYKNIDTELAYVSGGLSVIFAIHNRTIVLITALSKSTDRLANAKVI